MRNKVADFIEKQQLLSRGGLHIVALSGGADSVALLLILRELGYRVEAAHCNFRLRGEESDRDEQFVRSLCQSLNVSLHLIHFETADYAALHQVSIEMAARELRYGYFRQLCQDIGAETVCVAHHRDDAVETFLMNLLRGSGIHGLTGIRPRNGQIVRPLLCVSRQEIEDYLQSVGQDYVTDSTNLQDDVLRNKIRLNLLPMLKEINPKAAENIDKTAFFLQEAEKIFNKEVAAEISMLLGSQNPYVEQKVSIPQLLSQPSAEVILHEWLSVYGFNTTQIEQIHAHLIGESGREFHSATHMLVIDRDQLVLAPVEKPMKTLKMPESGRYRYDEHRLFSIEEMDDITISNSVDCATIDKSNIQYPLTVRPVQPGDTFCPFGMEGHKLLSDFLTDSKLSVLEKRRQLVITDAKGDILWVVGLRTDNRYRVKKDTSTILRITIINTF